MFPIMAYRYRPAPGTLGAELYTSDDKAFDEYRERISPARTHAFQQGIQGQMMSPSGGLRDASLGSGVVIRGSDLGRIADAQARQGGKYAGAVANVLGTQLRDDALGRERFRQERMKTRWATEDALKDAVRSGLKTATALGGNTAFDMRGIAQAVRRHQQGQFDDVATAYMAANPDVGYDQAALYAFETLGYDPYEQSGDYPWMSRSQVAGRQR